MPTRRPPASTRHLAAGVVLLVLLLVSATACSSDSPNGGHSGDGSRLTVVASFYPLDYLVTRLAGDEARVTNLTAPGAEPHDLELRPRDVATIADADLTVYLSGFQPAVDDAVVEANTTRVLDVAPDARLARNRTPLDTARADSQSGSLDPHFWLDPERYADVASAVGARLAQLAPAHRSLIEANLAALRRDLTELDRDFSDGLADCAQHELVTSHASFGYLAGRYGMEQVGITGLTPESEPSPDHLARITDFVRNHHVSTIYFETLVSPAVATTIARETGATTAVLDPLEGLTKASDGRDYLAVMRSNLRTLRLGQGCS